MKKSGISIVLFGAALLSASGAFAGDTNKGTLNLNETISVEGKTLKPGTYKLEWNGSGSDVQVSVLRGKETVATFPAHISEQDKQNSANGYGSSAQADGTRVLTAIYLGGKHTVLQLDANGTAAQSSNQGSK